jgi:hypothetical protein
MKFAMHILVFISLLLIGVARAESELEKLEHTTPQQRADAQTAFMKQKLHLTSQQAPQVADLNLTYAKKIDPILKGPEGKLRKGIEIRRLENEKENKLKAMLTSQQYQTFLGAKEQLREKVLESARAHQN